MLRATRGLVGGRLGGAQEERKGHRQILDAVVCLAMVDAKLEDFRLEQLRGLRREVAAPLENQATFSKQMVRLYGHVDRLSDDVRGLRDEVRRDFQSVKSDIVMLESQNISRHGETINAIRRIEGIERKTASDPEVASDNPAPEG